MLMTEESKKKPSKFRVMIADDVSGTRRGTRLMLSLNPTVEVVAIAKNGREAVEIARTKKLDIAIMDVNMPEMDGLTAIKYILSIQPNMVCIVISAEKENEVLRKAMVVGAREYLIKPFTAEELDLAILRAGQLVRSQKQKALQADNTRKQKEKYLKQLANEYMRTRRTDDQALAIYEQLALYPDCEIRLLKTLAMVYVIRLNWKKLKILATRLEKQVKET